ncbi:MAG: hypothetical protein R3A80_05845 [Bdellovibrionota bacterium]
MLKPLNKNYCFTKISLAAFALFFATHATAGVTHSVQQTAVTLQPGNYEPRGQGDVILNRGGGVNVSGHFKAGIIEDMLDAEAFIGTGKTDFKLGATAKFNLLPDLPGQVGLAFIGGFGFINDDYKGQGNDSIKVINLGAITSKKVDASFGSVSPYAGIQAELLFKDGDNDAPITGIVGAEWALSELNPWVFFSELDIDINDSVFLLAAGGAYRF